MNKIIFCAVIFTAGVIVGAIADDHQHNSQALPCIVCQKPVVCGDAIPLHPECYDAFVDMMQRGVLLPDEEKNLNPQKLQQLYQEHPELAPLPYVK